MALGFILFVLFCIFVIFVSTLAIVSLIVGCKFLFIYINLREKLYLIISTGSFLIGLFLILTLISGIRYFVGNSSPERTKILFIPTEGINNIHEITQIEQSIGSYGSKFRLGFLKIYEELYPSIYHMAFNNISEYVKKIKINSVKLIVNNDEQNIINSGYTSDITLDFKNRPNSLTEVLKLFRENGEVIMNTNPYDEIKSFKCGYRINFDYDSVEHITIIYNIEIELENNEINHIEQMTIFTKNIVEKTEKY
jgi:energy-coupling factor transporter transmembrane protein EcfT